MGVHDLEFLAELADQVVEGKRVELRWRDRAWCSCMHVCSSSLYMFWGCYAYRAFLLAALWNSSSVDMPPTISVSIVKSASSGSTSWSMESSNTRIWVHMHWVHGSSYMGAYMAWAIIWMWVHVSADYSDFKI